MFKIFEKNYALQKSDTIILKALFFFPSFSLVYNAVETPYKRNYKHLIGTDFLHLIAKFFINLITM